MKHALKSMSGQHTAQASVVDGKLILSFPHALTPVLWQIDLNDVKSSALEVISKDKDKRFLLISKTPDGTITEIAPFDNRDDAVEGLMAAGKALENAHGQIKNMPSSERTTHVYTAGVEGKKKSWTPVLVSLAVLALVVVLWASLSSRMQSANFETLANNTNTSASSNVNEPGVAISADDFLNRR